MNKRTVMTTLLVGLVVGGTALFSTIAMAHGGAGMMGDQDENIGQMPCHDDDYAGIMPHGNGYGMMGGMMGYGGMRSMMQGSRGGHMMDIDDMRHGGVLNQAEKLGLSNEQVRKLNTIRLTERKDIIRKEADVNVVRLDLSELLASDNWTVKDAEPLVHKLDNLERDIQLRHLQALNDARNILTADQLKQFNSTEQYSSSETYCNQVGYRNRNAITAMYGNGMIGNASMMGPFMWVFMALLWILVIVGVIYLVKSLSSRSRNDPVNEKSPLDVLKARYAKGEITDDEFERMKQKLATK